MKVFMLRLSLFVCVKESEWREGSFSKEVAKHRRRKDSGYNNTHTTTNSAKGIPAASWEMLPPVCVLCVHLSLSVALQEI
jgi:hypothetical protein